MILRKYGVELKSLTTDELELVRQWRNSEGIREQMISQQEIACDEQKRWFNNLTINDIYLTIRFENEVLGLINVKNIDLNKRTGESGIFVRSSKFSGSLIPMFAIYCLMDVAFKELDLLNLKATVKKTNTNAIRLNSELGYEMRSEDLYSYNMEVTKDRYEFNKSSKKWLLKLADKTNHQFTEEEKKHFKIG